MSALITLHNERIQEQDSARERGIFGGSPVRATVPHARRAAPNASARSCNDDEPRRHGRIASALPNSASCRSAQRRSDLLCRCRFQVCAGGEGQHRCADRKSQQTASALSRHSRAGLQRAQLLSGDSCSSSCHLLGKRGGTRAGQCRCRQSAPMNRRFTGSSSYAAVRMALIASTL